MMQKIFLWFYCLPISGAAFLIALSTVIFLFLRGRLGTAPCWKGILFLLLVCWTAVILYGTLGQRSGSGSLPPPSLIPFHSYRTALSSGSRELFRANFMNAVLFYPTGLLGYDLLPKRWGMRRILVLVTCICALTSIGIEYSQYRFCLGLAEADDIIHNTLGALLGAIACGCPIKLHKR